MSRIDGRDFARHQGSLSGRLSAADAPRLEQLGWRLEAVDFALRGRADGHGRLYLDVEAAGTLSTTCPRCLQSVEHAVRFTRTLRLADSLHEIEKAEDDEDRVLAGPAMDVGNLIEDELILELPMVVRHEQCEPLRADAPGGTEDDSAVRKGTLKSALQQWVQGDAPGSDKEQ